MAEQRKHGGCLFAISIGGKRRNRPPVPEGKSARKPQELSRMGKIKSKLIKRSAHEFIKKGIEFSDDFEKNKKILGNTMPSKKIRNQMAGYLTRVKKQEKAKKI